MAKPLYNASSLPRSTTKDPTLYKPTPRSLPSLTTAEQRPANPSQPPLPYLRQASPFRPPTTPSPSNSRAETVPGDPTRLNRRNPRALGLELSGLTPTGFGASVPALSGNYFGAGARDRWTVVFGDAFLNLTYVRRYPHTLAGNECMIPLRHATMNAERVAG
jgi:hypothetical protein